MDRRSTSSFVTKRPLTDIYLEKKLILFIIGKKEVLPHNRKTTDQTNLHRLFPLFFLITRIIIIFCMSSLSHVWSLGDSWCDLGDMR